MLRFTGLLKPTSRVPSSLLWMNTLYRWSSCIDHVVGNMERKWGPSWTNWTIKRLMCSLIGRLQLLKVYLCLSEKFLKTCLDTEPEDACTKGMEMGILSIVEDDVATDQTNPNVKYLSVVLEEQTAGKCAKSSDSCCSPHWFDFIPSIWATTKNWYPFDTPLELFRKCLLALTLSAQQEFSPSKTKCYSWINHSP